nr:MAG TPA: hypothetical protein [Caudoviricetes sp.]
METNYLNRLLGKTIIFSSIYVWNSTKYNSHFFDSGAVCTGKSFPYVTMINENGAHFRYEFARLSYCELIISQNYIQAVKCVNGKVIEQSAVHAFTPAV